MSALEELLRQRIGPRAAEWFDCAWAAAGNNQGRTTFQEDFTAVARRLGKSRLELEPAAVARLRDAGIDWSLGSWGLDELGRVVLIVQAATRWSPAELRAVLEACYCEGDNRERQAVLRSLPLLPEPTGFVSLAADACRSHVQPVFEAIACENPYPARHFPELNFNQLVLKALFTGVALSRIVGLPSRMTPELVRMAKDFASERAAAGRAIPPDIGRLTGAEVNQP